MKIKDLLAFYRLTKPKVLFANVLTTVAGFLFANSKHVYTSTFISTILGTTLIIASACVLNNYFDQDIDKKMERTKNRPLITGEVRNRDAVIFSLVLGVTGLIVLYIWASLLVVVIGVIGFITYVVLYGMISKRLSLHGTLVGGISGATPILAGYVAATNVIDWTAVILFSIIFVWQMPAFYSIAVFRRKEYKAARVPVVSVVRTIKKTKKLISIYILIFAVACVSLNIFSNAGITYLIIITCLNVSWFRLAWKGLSTNNNELWGRKSFRYSLVILNSFILLISLNRFMV